MKKRKELLVLLIVCIVLSGINTGIGTLGNTGKDSIGTLDYSQDVGEY